LPPRSESNRPRSGTPPSAIRYEREPPLMHTPIREAGICSCFCIFGRNSRPDQGWASPIPRSVHARICFYGFSRQGSVVKRFLTFCRITFELNFRFRIQKASPYIDPRCGFLPFSPVLSSSPPIMRSIFGSLLYAFLLISEVYGHGQGNPRSTRTTRSSSSQHTPAPTAVKKNPKRGISWAAESPADIQNVNQTASVISWQYDWANIPPAYLATSNVKYIPMQWGSGSIDRFVDAVRAQGADTILVSGFPKGSSLDLSR
jgi:hypothetical protein